jgi:hypothetical protein
MRKILNSITAILAVSWLLSTILLAQMDKLHGDDREYRIGVHAANQFRTSFYNDGTFGGRVNQPPQVAGEWPKNSTHYYLVDGNDFVGSEITDSKGNTYHINSETKCVDIGGSRGDKCGDDLHWCCFLPLPGFANINGDRVAMARGSNEVENSWPNYWPDIGDTKNPRYSADGWAGSWNGYFGRDVFNADEESYFVTDDWENKEFYPDYMCDTVVTDRGGLGVRVYVRGLEWTKSAVADGIFCIYDIENVGTYLHDKCVFGYKIGNNMGESDDGSDAGDDDAFFVREEDLAYMGDADNTGAGGWTPVGNMGGAFLESPGNRYDGIDNDNDGENLSGPTITTDMFEPKKLELSTPIVLINYDTFERTLTTLSAQPNNHYEFVYSSQVFSFDVDDTLKEIGDNLVDDNLNGLIDENRGRDDGTGVITYLYVGYKYINYFSDDDATNGKQNLLLDERRDDGIDNDEDWDPLFDDVGTDGLAPGATGYPGPDPDGTEGNGQPDAGEPHFDQTDINETDMLGLTSFNLYDWSSLNQYDDEAYWNAMQPGLFILDMTSTNVELLFASGYFPLVPGQIERFSVAVICGEDYDDIVNNKRNFAEAYTQNYNFAKAPLIPKVQAIAGDNRVLLFWDAAAEGSVDPISTDPEGKDFEGYRIYRSTDPGFNDPKKITDAHIGTQIGMKPMAQFDLDNDYEGYAADPYQGVHFWLGEDTGLRHYYIDDTAVNGFTYYYAVTSYDHGDPTKGIDPSECSIYVAVQASGEVEKGDNVVIVRPEAPAAGYQPARIDENGIALGDSNTASGGVSFTVIRPDLIKNDHKYQITFRDTLSSSLYPTTRDFTLKDITDNVILLKDTGLVGGVEGLPITDGFQLAFENNPDELTLNADSSGWSQAGIPAFEFVRYSPSPSSRPIELIVADFEIIFGGVEDVGMDRSDKYYLGTNEIPPMDVNFTIVNTLTNARVPFAFRERAGDDGVFSFDASRRRSDEIIFLADPDPDTPVASWVLRYVVTEGDSLSPIPGAGTTLTLKTDKPFLAHDTFEFTVLDANIDKDQAKADLKKIRVVPNPYIVTNSWEPENRYSSGRGERQLHFIHLPAKCKIRIFNTRGQLVRTLNHEAAIDDGTEIWDMLSKDKLDISYGIYIYHIEAEGIGEKIGKFAVIK